MEDAVTAEAKAKRLVDHASLPSLTLDARQLGDLELILSGAFTPLGGFMTSADVASVAESATLADRTPWPVPVTLKVPAEALEADADEALLADPEGTPLAVLTITERATLPGADGRVGLAGPVRAHRVPEHGSFRRLMISPSQARAELGRGPVLAFATSAPIGGRQIGQLKHLAGQLGARLLVLPMVAGPAEVVRQPEALIRAVLAAAISLPAGTLVVPVPYAERYAARAREPAARAREPAARAREPAAIATIAAAYGATHLMVDGWHDNGGSPTTEIGSPAGVHGAPIQVL